MRSESVEIFSEATNAAVMRHPGRRFPGVLLQGDTLNGIVAALRSVMERSDALPEEQAETLASVVAQLSELLAHYRSVLVAHNIPLPFPEASSG